MQPKCTMDLQCSHPDCTYDHHMDINHHPDPDIDNNRHPDIDNHHDHASYKASRSLLGLYSPLPLLVF